ncbi:MAG: PilZ domain-containing protein [Deltaproteobacteria bacterium]|nr:PilZ domain-containing protein [Deltaproteobacteria bacterium]
MGSNSRDSKRITMRGKVKYGTTGHLKHFAFISDLSETGLCIRTNDVYDEDTILNLRINFGGGNYNAKGIVMWSIKVPRGLEKIKKNGMGIKFTTVDPELIKVYNEKTIDKETEGGEF